MQHGSLSYQIQQGSITEEQTYLTHRLVFFTNTDHGHKKAHKKELESI